MALFVVLLQRGLLATLPTGSIASTLNSPNGNRLLQSNLRSLRSDVRLISDATIPRNSFGGGGAGMRNLMSG